VLAVDLAASLRRSLPRVGRRSLFTTKTTRSELQPAYSVLFTTTGLIPTQCSVNDIVQKIHDAGGKAVGCEARLTAAAIVDTAVNTFGRLDVLVNNAGVDLMPTWTDTQLSDWDSMIAETFGSSYRVSRALYQMP
jgi:NAD(P)-dependent dehydrogenase (short-subunit alcohol dehydrogenase family)